MFHPPKWLMYVAIVVVCALMAWLLINMLGNSILHRDNDAIELIETTKQEKKEFQDSLREVIVVKMDSSAHVIESLSRKQAVMEKKTADDKFQLYKEYEKAFRLIDSLSDDSVSRAYAICRAKADSLFTK